MEKRGAWGPTLLKGGQICTKAMLAGAAGWKEADHQGGTPYMKYSLRNRIGGSRGH